MTTGAQQPPPVTCFPFSAHNTRQTLGHLPSSLLSRALGPSMPAFFPVVFGRLKLGSLWIIALCKTPWQPVFLEDEETLQTLSVHPNPSLTAFGRKPTS